MSDRPVSLAAAASWLGIPAELLRFDPGYDAATDTLLMPASMVRRIEGAEAAGELRAALLAPFLPLLARLDRLLTRR